MRIESLYKADAAVGNINMVGNQGGDIDLWHTTISNNSNTTPVHPNFAKRQSCSIEKMRTSRLASTFAKCAFVLYFATIASAQLAVSTQSALKHWEREVKYYGPEKNANQILKVMTAFAQHYVERGYEPPRSKFNSLHYHNAWNTLRNVGIESIFHRSRSK